MRKDTGVGGEVSRNAPGSFPARGLGERVGEFLRRAHPVKTSSCVAADVGAPMDTVDYWLRGGAPSLRWFVALVGAYGPEFLAAACPQLDWLDEAVIAAEKAAIEEKMAALAERRAELEKTSHARGRLG